MKDLIARTVIHVNQNVIRRNRKHGYRNPVLTVKGYKAGNVTHSTNQYGHEAVIYGDDGYEVARVVYRPDDPLPCGAQVWIETDKEVVVE